MIIWLLSLIILCPIILFIGLLILHAIIDIMPHLFIFIVFCTGIAVITLIIKLIIAI